MSIKRELSLSWMFRAKRRRPVGGDVDVRTDAQLGAAHAAGREQLDRGTRLRRLPLSET